MLIDCGFFIVFTGLELSQMQGVIPARSRQIISAMVKPIRRVTYQFAISYQLVTPEGTPFFKGAQWLSGRVLDSRPRGREFEPHQRLWGVVLEQDTFILA